MIEQLSLQTVLTYLTLISVPIGVFYHIMTLRNTRKNQELTLKAQEQALETRQAQMFMQLYGNYMTTEYIVTLREALDMDYTDFDDFQAKYSRHPQRTPYTKMCFFFDGIGLLVEEGLIDIKFVAKLMSGDIMWHWNRFGPYILEMRKRRNWPEYMYYSEYLYNEVVKLRPDHSQIKRKGSEPKT